MLQNLMRSALLILLLLTCSGIASSAIEGVTKVDVKTSFKEKRENRHLKAGLIDALEESPLFKVVEVREDYSVWITNVGRRRVDSGRYELYATIELRTPAMFSKGKLLEERTVGVVYDPNGIDVRELLDSDSLPLDPLTDMIVGTLGNVVVERVVGLVVIALPGGAMPAAALVVVKNFVAGVVNKMQEYSNVETLEGLLLGPQAAYEIELMIRSQ